MMLQPRASYNLARRVCPRLLAGLALASTLASLPTAQCGSWIGELHGTVHTGSAFGLSVGDEWTGSYRYESPTGDGHFNAAAGLLTIEIALGTYHILAPDLGGPREGWLDNMYLDVAGGVQTDFELGGFDPAVSRWLYFKWTPGGGSFNTTDGVTGEGLVSGTFSVSAPHPAPVPDSASAASLWALVLFGLSLAKLPYSGERAGRFES